MLVARKQTRKSVGLDVLFSIRREDELRIASVRIDSEDPGRLLIEIDESVLAPTNASNIALCLTDRLRSPSFEPDSL